MKDPLQIHRELSADLSTAEIAELRHQVRRHYEELVEAQQRTELVAVDLALLLCERLEQLLDQAPAFTAANRAAVIGAARYYASMHDVVPDAKACTGLDDDVAVFNHVVTSIGRPDLVIDE